MDDPSLASMPMLVADLANDESRDLLESIAADEGTIVVPLVIAPADASRHVLEVYSPGFEQALVLLAEPSGPPTREGFPLRLSLPASAKPRASTNKTTDNALRLEPRRITTHTLTEGHERHLTTGQPLQPVRVTGRKLAGGKLAIETFVGSGGAGSVYKALHRDLQIPVAVKVLHEELQRDVDFCRRFHAEALAASRLDHANLTRVIDFGQEPDGTLYLAMEFLAGKVLRDVLKEERRLPLARALGIMAQVCAGLAHAHARGVVHRDVKPENMVLLASTDDDGRSFELVKVCDFGIAQQPTSTDASLAGTPEYMAPEQWMGDEIGAGTDVYASGVMLYELTTGRLPFEGTPREIFERQLKGPPDPPSRHVAGFDPRLEAIIMQTLAQDVAKRPADMRELRTMLRALRLSRMDLAKVKVPSLKPQAPRPAPAAKAAVEEEEAPPASEDPEWLERSGAWAARANESSRKIPVAQEDPVAKHLLRDPTPILAELAKTTDPAAFHKLAVMVDPAIRSLAARGESATLWRLVSTLDILADEGPRKPGSRAAIAALLLRVAYDPQVIGPIAEDALNAERQTLSPAWKLVVRASTGGVYALYQARLKYVTTEARQRFVRLYREIGAPVLPVVRAGLERLAPRLENEAAAALASDLLEAAPAEIDDATGAIIARYVQAKDPLLAAAAAGAVVRVWGARACPVLVGLLHHADARVVASAIAGLVELHAVDEPIARKLTNVVASHPGTAARVAAVEALAKAEASGLAFVGRALRRMLASVTEKWPPNLALAVVRALLAVGDANDRTLIRDQSRSWPPSLEVAVAGVLAAK